MSNHKPIFIFEPLFPTSDILKEIKICLDKGWTGLGFKTIEFEEKWKKYTNLPNAHFVSSCTAALHLAVHVLKKFYKWEDEDEIITTPFTFVSSNHVILYENLKPVFADIDQYLCLDPISVEKKITKKTKAVMFVGIAGNTGQIKQISKICKERNLKLILDAAHMTGTKIRKNNRILHVGSEADVSAFGFHSVKNLPTADSGMLCFKNKKLDQYSRKLSWLGIDKTTFKRKTNKKYNWEYDINEIGFKYHGNSIMASMAIVGLKYIDKNNEKRNKMSNLYKKLLQNIPEVKTICIHPYCVLSSRHLFQIRVAAKKRNKLIQFLNAKKIFPGVHYKDNTCYKPYRYAYGSCPSSLKASKEIISLPLHLKLNSKKIKYVTDSIKKYFCI